MWAFLFNEKGGIFLQQNSICHYLSPDGIRLTAADTSGAAANAEIIHQMPGLSAVILAKVMTGAAILANDFKNKEGVTFKWVTGSPLGVIHADAYDGRFVRGYEDNPDAGKELECTLANEANLVSRNGQLFVTRYSLLKMPYTSAVNLAHSDVAACLTEYLNLSEQTLSAVNLTVRIDPDGKIIHSSGFLAQLMPGGDLQRFAEYFRQTDLCWDTAAAEEQPDSLESLLKKGRFEMLDSAPLDFCCTCSEERIHSTLLTLPETEKEDLLKDPSIEIVCHYCGKTYRIERDVLKKWFAENRGGLC